MTQNPKISIVIPVYNAEKFLLNTLQSVLKTDYPNFEVVVVNDNSHDRSKEILKKYIGNPVVKTFHNNKRMMAAASRNIGIDNSTGKYIALLDHDIEVDEKWLKEAMKVFKKYPETGTVQGVVRDISRKNLIQHAGIVINAKLGWVISKGFGRTIDEYNPKEEEVFANATGLIFKKEVWVQLGGFDEDLAINIDDWDFNWRSWLYGYKQILAPKSVTYHWSKKQKVRDQWIKRVSWEFHFAKVPWIFIKNYELKNIIKFLPVYLFVNLFRVLVNFIFRFNPAPFIAYIKALLWITINIKSLLKKRADVQEKRKIPDSYLLDNLMDKRSIVYYFIKYWWPTVALGKVVSTENPF